MGTASHPSSVSAYLKQGFHLIPIPPNTKGPHHHQWNHKERGLQSAEQLPQGWGIGVGHAYCSQPTCAIDIDDWDTAKDYLTLYGVDLDALYDADDAVIIDSGRPGHGKLLYRMPAGLPLPSEKLITTRDDGKKYNFLDFRCSNATNTTVQDVLPPSIHPDTQQPYRWAGKGDWRRIPTLPTALHNLWISLIQKNKVDQKSQNTGTVKATIEQVNAAMEFIDPDISRDEWVSVGMALHWYGTKTDRLEECFHIWHEWSKHGEKYKNEKDLIYSWRSFGSDRGVTVATLFGFAKKGGWDHFVDMSSMFGEVRHDHIQTPPQDGEVKDQVKRIAGMGVKDIALGMKAPKPVLPLDLFPAKLKNICDEVATSVGCDPIVPLYAGLSVVCGAVTAETRIRLSSSWTEPPLLWLLTIGDPSDKKTPGSKPMVGVLGDIEKEDGPNHTRRLTEWMMKENIHKEQQKQLQAYVQNGEHHLGNSAMPIVEQIPRKPQPLRFVVNDVTTAKLVRLCGHHNRGLLCFMDEMDHFMRTATDPRSTENRSVWTQCYNAGRYNMDRVGSGDIETGYLTADNLAVAFYGNVQPAVLHKYFKNLSSDGLIQRFIPGIIRAEYTNTGQNIPEFMSQMPLWDTMIRGIYALDAAEYGLSPEAQEVFDAFHAHHLEFHRNEVIGGKSQGMGYDVYTKALGKVQGIVGRLMLVFHLIENPHEKLVSADIARRVIEIVMTFVIPSYRYAHVTIGDPDIKTLDETIMDYMLQHADEGTFTIRDIKRYNTRVFGDMSTNEANERIMDTMEAFVADNWAMVVDERRNGMRWSINPAIKHMHEERRRLVLFTRQMRADQMQTNLAQHTGKAFERINAVGFDPETMEDDYQEFLASVGE